MSTSATPAREVPVDVLPPVPRAVPPPLAAHGDPRAHIPFDGIKTFYHPASGVVILALDWLIFGTDLFSGFLAVPAMCVIGFLATFPLVLAIQRKWSGDTFQAAMAKAFLGAFMVGLPFPVTGTLLGAAILALSGLPHHPVDVVKRLAKKR